MRKFLLSMALVLCTIGAMAQSTINFTFTRNGENATVNVEGADGVTATIAATSPNPQSNATKTGVWNTGGNMGTDTDILCTSTNTSAATTPITYTLTVNGLNASMGLSSVVFTHITADYRGNYQPQTNNDIRHCNFVLDVNGSQVASKTDFDIWIQAAAGNTGKDVAFEGISGVKANDGTLTIKLYISKGTTNNGCFYGLKNVAITLVEETVEPEPEPEPLVKTGQFYTINLTPGYTGTDRAGASMYVHSDAKLRCNKITGDITAKNVFIFEEGEDGNIYMKNVATQTYISAIGSNASQDAISADSETTEGALEISFGYLGDKTVDDNTVNIFEIQPGNNAMLNCASIDGTKLGRVVSFTPGSDKINKASAWYLTEVTDFKYTLEVGTAQWATVVLGFNATIPTTENFKAYTIASEEDGYVTLEEVTGVLAANVPVIVNAPQGNYDFVYTTDEATVTTSGLQGTLYNKDITANAYVLGLIDGEVGFGKATTTGKAEGTFTNNANKAYFEPTNALANIASYSFRFGEGTTGVEKVEIRNEKSEIYDLTGRRVETISAPGIYIVGGRKVLVK